MGQQERNTDKIRMLVLKVNEQTRVISDSRSIMQVHEERIGRAIVERSKATKELLDELDKLDVLAKGNTGWEARTVKFLAELLGYNKPSER